MTRRIIVNAVKTNLLEILESQVEKLRDVSNARMLDKTEILLLKTCMELHDTKLDVLEDLLVVNRVIQSDEEKVKIMTLALKN